MAAMTIPSRTLTTKLDFDSLIIRKATTGVKKIAYSNICPIISSITFFIGSIFGLVPVSDHRKKIMVLMVMNFMESFTNIMQSPRRFNKSISVKYPRLAHDTKSRLSKTAQHTQPFVLVSRYTRLLHKQKIRMKKTAISLILPVIFFIACKKNQNDPAVPPGQESIAGTWMVDSVRVYFYNASGLLDSSEIGYPAEGLQYPLYFQFNDDHSWSEALVAGADTTIVAKGTYSSASNNMFNLMYPDANPAKQNEPCNILSLTNTSFIFSKQLPTVFNGRDPGSIKYVFRLTK